MEAHAADLEREMAKLNISESVLDRVVEAWKEASVMPQHSQMNKKAKQLRMQIVSRVLKAS